MYGILAHSRVWKQLDSRPHLNIDKYLYKYDKEFVAHPREVLDFLCVADLMTWVSHISAYYGPAYITNYSEFAATMRDDPMGYLTTGYMKYMLPSLPTHPPQPPNLTPIGTLISALLDKLAWNDPSIRGLAEYFHLTRIRGACCGQIRKWSNNVYTDQVREKVLSGALVESDIWNEWSMNFY